MYKSVTDNYEEKKKKLKDRVKEERNTLRYQKLITATAKTIIEKDSKILNKDDWDKIVTSVYGKTDRIKNVRVRRQMSTDIAKRDINQAIQSLLLAKGIDETKIVGLVQKGEDKAKTTNEYLSVAREYKDLLGINSTKSSTKVTRTQKITDFSKFREGKEEPHETVTVTKTITKEHEDADSE